MPKEYGKPSKQSKVQRMTARGTSTSAPAASIAALKPSPDSKAVTELLARYGNRVNERHWIELWTLQVTFDQFKTPEPERLRPRLPSSTPSGD